MTDVRHGTNGGRDAEVLTEQREARQEGCRTGGSRTGGKQVRREAGQEGCKTVWVHSEGSRT